MFTKIDLIRHLEEIGVPQNKPVIVHTSLKAVGEIEGGGQTLLDALIEHVTLNDGLVVVPTHTFDNYYTDHKFISLDFNNFRPCVGTFPIIAAADARGKTALNPTHSVTVFGDEDKVNEFIECEKSVDTPTSPKGSYGKLFDLKGSVLLIGVGQEKNTYLHCVEEMLNVPNRLSNDKVTLGVRFRDGTIFEKETYYMYSKGIYDPSEYFGKYEPAFRHHGAIVDGYIGNAKVQLCSVVKMTDVFKTVRERSGGVELLADHQPLNEEWYKI